MGRSRTLCGLIAATAVFAAPVAAAEAADPLRSQQYGLDIVESDAAHATTTGRGAVVAIVDTGVRASHQDLQGRLLPQMSFVEGDGPEDEDGHGTHVLGIAVANKDNGVGVSSVAPGATALPVRVLGDDGSGSSADVAKGIDFAVAKGAHVINLSLGDTVPVGAITGSQGKVEEAILRALGQNVVVVASSGNNGAPICEQALAKDPRLLCVGSVDRARNRSVFSSFVGPEGITAPGGNALGDDILSTFSLDRNGRQTDSGYTELAGTSQAAPHVAGVAALLVQLGLRGQDVVRRLRETAVDAGLPGPDEEFGAGIVNARQAVAGLGPQPGGSPGGESPGGGSPGGGGGGAGGGGTPGGGDTGGGSGASATVTVARFQRFRSVLKTGIKVRCTATAAGRCTATVRRGSRIFASGSRNVRSGQRTTLLVRLTGSARRAVKGANRRNRRIKLRLEVTVPGAATQFRRTTLRR